MRAGFPVPDGFVLTTVALDGCLAANGISPDAFPEYAATAALPDDIAEALFVAAAALGDAPLAVRSSAVAEDLPGSSFAGQYDTELGVHGADALVASVKRCWASSYGERATAYQAATGRGDAGMAVLVQRMVPAELAWVEAHTAPASYGKDPGPPPSFAVLPSEARFVHEALMWVADRIYAPQQSGQEQASETTLRGIAASPGDYTGPVRVIMNEGEFAKLRPGDVLVCPITSPVWSVLFPSIGALVTDSGGILSHPAIIAREYRVPAIVATGNGTRLLRDGQIVTVNGDTGTVELGL